MHILVVIVLEPAVRMVMMRVIVVVMMIMIVVMIVGLQEFRLDLQDAVEIEGVAPQHLVERNLRALRVMQPGVGIDAADARLDLAQFASLTRSVLLSRITSAKAIWFFASGASFSRSLQPLGVGHGHDRIELGLLADLFVDEEGLRHRRRIGEPRGLHDDGVELALAPHQPVDDADQVAAHGAADAAVVHLEHFLVGVDHQVVVDADLAEFVDDHGVFLAVRLGQDAVEQRGLAGAEIAGQHRDGDFVSTSSGSRGHGTGSSRRISRPERKTEAAVSWSARRPAPYIVPHQVDVGGRRALLGQRIGIERAADLGAGLRGIRLKQPRIADILQEDRRILLLS